MGRGKKWRRLFNRHWDSSHQIPSNPIKKTIMRSRPTNPTPHAEPSTRRAAQPLPNAKRSRRVKGPRPPPAATHRLLIVDCLPRPKTPMNSRIPTSLTSDRSPRFQPRPPASPPPMPPPRFSFRSFDFFCLSTFASLTSPNHTLTSAEHQNSAPRAIASCGALPASPEIIRAGQTGPLSGIISFCQQKVGG